MRPGKGPPQTDAELRAGDRQGSRRDAYDLGYLLSVLSPIDQINDLADVFWRKSSWAVAYRRVRGLDVSGLLHSPSLLIHEHQRERTIAVPSLGLLGGRSSCGGLSARRRKELRATIKVGKSEAPSRIVVGQRRKSGEQAVGAISVEEHGGAPSFLVIDLGARNVTTLQGLRVIFEVGPAASAVSMRSATRSQIAAISMSNALS